MKKMIHHQEGQAMILSVILLGGLLLGASAIAGLLTIFQIRQSNSVVNSTQAIFAADAGLEWATYVCYAKSLCDPVDEGKMTITEEVPVFSLAAGAEVYQYAVDENGRWKFSAEGEFRDSVRLLEVTFGTQP